MKLNPNLPSWKSAVLMMALGLVFFFWGDFLNEFLSLPGFKTESVTVVSVNNMNSVYWSSLDVSGEQAEGYFHESPVIGDKCDMITITGQTYYDYVDTIAFVDGQLNYSGGLLVLNLTSQIHIGYLKWIVNGLGWGCLAFGLINYISIRRSLKHDS